MSDTKPTKNLFAVVPDGHRRPAALFSVLEEAIDWAVNRFGADRFAIRAFVSEVGRDGRDSVAAALSGIPHYPARPPVN